LTPKPGKCADNPRSILPQIHRTFSNLKTRLAGTHHGIYARNVPVYLRELEFRFNRRRTSKAAFQALLGLPASIRLSQFDAAEAERSQSDRHVTQ